MVRLHEIVELINKAVKISAKAENVQNRWRETLKLLKSFSILFSAKDEL